LVVKKVGKDWIKVPDTDPLQILLEQPRTSTPTSFEFLTTVISQLLLTGHVGILPFPPGSSRYIALWVIPKQNLEPVKTSRGQLDGWIYKPKPDVDDGIPLSIDELASIKFFNPKDPIMGMSPIEAGRLAIRTEYKASVYNEKFFDEGAVPGGILSSDNRITDSQFERIKKQFEDKHKGFTRGHRLAILDNGLKFTQTGLSQKDMMFPDLKKMTRESILQIFGMKKVVVSVTDDLNYATAKTERQEWWQGTNLPLMGMIETALTACIFKKDQTHKIVFDTSNVEALHSDFSEKVTTAEKLFKIGFSANEINARLQLGFEHKPWRDHWYVASNVVRVEEDGTIAVQNNPAMLPPSQQPPKPNENDDDEEEDGAVEDDAAKALELKYNLIEYKSGFTPEEEDRLNLRWRDIFGRAEYIEWEFESKVRRVFFEMRKKALKLLNTKTIRDTEMEEFLDDKKDLIAFTVPIYEKAMRLGAATLAEELEVTFTFNLNDPQVIYYLTYAPLKVTQVIDTVKNQIRSELIAGVTANEPIDAIAGRLRGVFKDAHKRAMTIARTEVGRALNYVRNMEIQAAPYRLKIWFTALDERVRASHKLMHGLKIPVNQPWVVNGSSLRFPGDPQGAASETINCRCIEIVDTSTRIV
jgi:HK97 family phage portal protein